MSFNRRTTAELMPIYIASGTPEEELHEIIAAKELNSYFKGAYGSPASKSEISNKIIAAERVSASGCLFIGDTLTDYQEATKVGVRFIGRWDGKLRPWNPFLDLGVPVVKDLTDLTLRPAEKSAHKLDREPDQ